jgi:serine/threonine protein kinase
MDEKLRKLEKEWSGKLITSDYEVVSILGQGAYGSVVRVQNTTNPTEQYAVKIIKREKLGKPGSKQFKLYNRLMTEKKITGLINQENILSCKKFINEKSNPFVFMFLDICNNGELDQYIKNQYLKKKIQIREGEAIHLLGSISNGFKVLNWYNIMHRDVKPANILVKDGVIKIADFGGMRFGSKQTGTVFGTRKYLAPEILQIYVSTLKNKHHEIKGNTHFYDSRVDVFS